MPRAFLPALLFFFCFTNYLFAQTKPEILPVWYPDSVARPLPDTTADPHPDSTQVLDLRAMPFNMADLKQKVKYPIHLKEGGIQGKVILKVLINEMGMPVKYIVIKNPHPDLANACAQPLYILRCKPALLNNKPVKSWIIIPFSGKIQW